MFTYSVWWLSFMSPWLVFGSPWEYTSVLDYNRVSRPIWMWMALFHGLRSWTESKGESGLNISSCLFLLPDCGDNVVSHLKLLPSCLPTMMDVSLQTVSPNKSSFLSFFLCVFGHINKKYWKLVLRIQAVDVINLTTWFLGLWNSSRRNVENVELWARDPYNAKYTNLTGSIEGKNAEKCVEWGPG